MRTLSQGMCTYFTLSSKSSKSASSAASVALSCTAPTHHQTGRPLPAHISYQVHKRARTSFLAQMSSSLSSLAVLRMRMYDARSVAAFCSDACTSCCTA